MEKIILSADSTCDLDGELKERYQVHYYPLHIILEGNDYLDNVDITTEDIYKAYDERKVLPKTAAVNVQEYIDYLKPWVDQGYQVIHLNIGHAISSSYQNCVLAAEELGNVYPVDSCNLSTGMGLLVVEAGRMIAEGMKAADIAEKLKRLVPYCHASFVLDTLKFMHAGGRCSAITALGANVLQIKPCIEVDNTDGSMSVGKKYRGSLEKAIRKYVQDQFEQYSDIITDILFITHSGIPETYIQAAKEEILKIKIFKEIHVTKASCTISAHCGPGTLGILFKTVPDNE